MHVFYQLSIIHLHLSIVKSHQMPKVNEFEKKKEE